MFFIRSRLGTRMFTLQAFFSAGNDSIAELKLLILMGGGLTKSAATKRKRRKISAGTGGFSAENDYL